MSNGNDDVRDGGPTRRDTLKYGATAAAGIGLAGCSDLADQAGGGTPTGTGSYTVSMAPAGDVRFDSVPESWMSYFSTYGDMAIALGQADGMEAAIFTENWPTQFFDYLPGVDISLDGVEQIWADSGISRERFYELGCDVHLMDPNFIQLLDDSWETADFEDVRTDIGPIIGNVIRLRNQDWHDYEYYTLYEAFEKIAQVFQEQERYAALKSVHDQLIDDLQSELPPRSERPEIGLMSVNDDFEAGVFSLYQIGAGNGKKQYQDLGINDAFADLDPSNTNDVDYELLLDIDPDILVFQFGVSHVTEATVEEKKAELRNDSLGSQLSAVQNDRLYVGGTAYQGPIINLFQTEMAAKQFYPEIFGEWEGYETLADEDNWLFDHQRVANIINGDIDR